MGMMDDLKKTTAEIEAEATGKELPGGVAPIEEPPAKEEEPEAEVEAQAAPAAEEDESLSIEQEAEAQAAAEEAVAQAQAAPGKKIKIGSREFESQDEAFDYAAELERERLMQEAYSQGIRDSLQSRQPQEAQQEPEEDNFEEEFYLNPKEALKKVEERAEQRVMTKLNQRDAEERVWNDFSNKFPDLADSREEVERIYAQHHQILSKMQDKEKAMKILAQKTRAYFDDIVARRAPKRELPQNKTQAVSTGGEAPKSVTPKKKDERPLTMAEQMKSMRRAQH